MEKDKNRTFESFVDQTVFELGKSGRIEPADLNCDDFCIYTWRRQLPPEEQTEDMFAEDVPVNVIKVSPSETYFMVPVECLSRQGDEIVAGHRIFCKVTPDGIVLNKDPRSPNVEHGYFLQGEALPGFDSLESSVMSKVPAALGRIGLESPDPQDRNF